MFGDASHVFLSEVKKADFECLLSVFYPEYESMLFTIFYVTLIPYIGT